MTIQDRLEALLDEFDAFEDGVHKPALNGPQGIKARLRSILADLPPSREAERRAFMAALEWVFPLGLGDQQGLAEAEAKKRFPDA